MKVELLRNCGWCGAEFAPHHSRHIFCSRKCSNASSFYNNEEANKARAAANMRRYQKTSRQKGRHRNMRRRHWLGIYKVAVGCQLCGYNSHPMALQFDHIGIHNKKGAVSDMLKGSKLSILMDEIRKCRVLCANCHMIETYKQRYGSEYKKGLSPEF